jgi:hypothetical protein
VLVLTLATTAPLPAQYTGSTPVAQTPRQVPLVVPPPPTYRLPAAIQPVRYQLGGRAGAPDESQPAYQIQLEPPGLERLTQGLQSDSTLQERIRQETLSNPSTANERVDFPDEPILSRDRYMGRTGAWRQRGMVVEPNFVCYGKLLYEDKNAERYGWDFGGPGVALAYGQFLWDTLLLPAHLFNDPCRKNECSAGYCLPGDPVPFLLYPPEITVSGAVAEVAVIMALMAIFP